MLLIQKKIRGHGVRKDGDLHRRSAASESGGFGREDGASRSRLFAKSVAEYVHQPESEELLRRLNEAHADGPDEEDMKVLRHMQTLHSGCWREKRG
jgi:hypothetical protein